MVASKIKFMARDSGSLTTVQVSALVGHIFQTIVILAALIGFLLRTESRITRLETLVETIQQERAAR